MHCISRPRSGVMYCVVQLHCPALQAWHTAPDAALSSAFSWTLQYAGYQNNGTAFSPGLKANLDYVDQSFARILAALNSSGNAATTGLVITAKHGQQPVTTNATLISPTPIATALKNQNIRYKLQIHHSPDQVVCAGRSISLMVC